MAKKGRAKGSEVGVGYVSIVPEAKDFARALESAINPKALGTKLGKDLDAGIKTGLGPDPIGSRLKASAKGGGSALEGIVGGMSKVALGAAGMGAAVFAAGKVAFDAYSDQNEAITKAQVVFGDAFARVDEVARGAAKSMGISRTTALDTAATFGNLFRAMGIGVDQAADMSLSIEQLGADLGSFNNVPTEEALDAIKSGLVGETEPLRRFGVNMNQARIEAEALSLGLVHNKVASTEVTAATTALEKAQVAQNDALKKHGQSSIEYRTATAAMEVAQGKLDKAMEGHKVELDASQKAQAAYSIIMRDTALAQGDFARTADGAANKTKTLGAQFEDLKAKVGEQLAPAGIAILGGLSTSLDWLSNWWTENGPTVMAGLDSIKQWFTDTFGPDPVANFSAGADIIKGKFDEIFGPDAVANFHSGADQIGGLWDEMFADFENGAIILNEKTTPAWDDLGNAILWVKDKVLDPFWGFLQQFGPYVLEELGLIVDMIEGLLDWIGKLGGSVWEQISRSFPGNRGIEGHDAGGVIGGPVGAGRPVLAHGGETVLPTHKPAWAALRGVTAADVAAALAPAPGALVGNLTVNGASDPAGSAWAMRRELRRVAYYAGSVYGGPG